MSAFLVLPITCIIALIASLTLRWLANRPEPIDNIPVSPEDLAREKPAVAVADISFENLNPLLERIENATDWGFSSTQRTSLVTRISKNHPGVFGAANLAAATFPVRYNSESVDLLMHFAWITPNIIRCRFESSNALITRIQAFLAEIQKNEPA